MHANARLIGLLVLGLAGAGSVGAVFLSRPTPHAVPPVSLMAFNAPQVAAKRERDEQAQRERARLQALDARKNAMEALRRARGAT